MSDNDVIKRGDVLARKCKYYVYDETGCCCEEFAVPVEDIKRIPAIPREMSAVEYVHISNLMLKKDYRAWDRLMVFEENDDADKAIAWMKEWVWKHREEVKYE